MRMSYKSIEVHYNVEGSGPSLLLLHGLLENTSMWAPFIPLLVKSRQVVCVDLPGHGKTGCLSGVHSMEEMANVVAAVLDELAITSVDVVGHSMGGYVALALLEQHPKRIRDLVLLNSTFEADTEERRLLRKRAIEVAQENYEDLVRLSYSNLFAAGSPERFKTGYRKGLAEALKTPLCGYVGAQAGMRLRADRLHILKRHAGACTLITGTKDALIDAATLKKVAVENGISPIEFSGGHMSHIENKSELSYFLKRFIEK
jgi:pimeloyl-ACP methyl ester carboxylesterase